MCRIIRYSLTVSLLAALFFFPDSACLTNLVMRCGLAFSSNQTSFWHGSRFSVESFESDDPLEKRGPHVGPPQRTIRCHTGKSVPQFPREILSVARPFP